MHQIVALCGNGLTVTPDVCFKMASQDESDDKFHQFLSFQDLHIIDNIVLGL